MAEEVIIGGWGDGGRNMPDFATEATQKQISEALKNANLLSKGMAQFMERNARGDRNAAAAITTAIRELKQTNNVNAKKTTSDEQTRGQKEERQAQKTYSLFEKMFASQEASRKLQEKQLKEDKARRSSDLQGTGMDRAEADLIADFEATQKSISDQGSKLATGIGGIIAMLEGFNSFAIQAGRERFDFAQELRQSGLAAGMDTATASMTSFADVVSRNNFLLGEAAKFTEDFTKVVGIMGVDSALKFANSMTQAESVGGADMMRRFGLEFSEVTNLSGQYLDTLRRSGQLENMSAQQMRSGMEGFMTTVSGAANVMKINMVDAAQMIADTLGRADIESLLTMMDPAQAETVRNVVGMAGGMDNALGEALAMRLASGSQGAFVQTDAYERMINDPVSQQLLPLVEQLAVAAETGGQDAFLNQLASSGGVLSEFVEAAGNSKALILQGDTQIAELVQAANQLRQLVDDANAGATGVSEDDVAALNTKNVERLAQRTMEDIQTQIVKDFDFAENVSAMNETSANFLAQTEEAVVSMTNVNSLIAEVSTFTNQLLTNLGTLVGGIAEATGRLFGGGDEANAAGLLNDRDNAIFQTGNGTPSGAVTQQEIDRVRELIAGGRETADGKLEYNQEVATVLRKLGKDFDDLSMFDPEAFEGLAMESLSEMSERMSSDRQVEASALIDAAEELKSIPQIIERSIQSNLSMQELLQADSGLYDEYQTALAAKVEELKQADRDAGIDDAGIRRRRSRYEMEAMNDVLPQFADRINETLGDGTVTVTETMRNDPQYQRLVDIAERMGLDVTRLDELDKDRVSEMIDIIQRNQNPEFMGAGTISSTTGIMHNDIDNLQELLGIGDTSRTLEAGSQELVYATALIKEMIEKEAMNRDQLAELIARMNPETGRYRVKNRLFDGMDDDDVAKENQELRILVNALNRLATQLGE